MTDRIKGQSGPILGKWRISAVTGLTTGLAAGNPIFSARFAPTANIRALITDIRLKAQIVTPFTAANEVNAQVQIARSFTASDTGGTSVLPTGIQAQLSSVSDSAYTTSFTDMRVATTGTLTAGTRTLDPNPILYLAGAQLLAAAGAAQGYSETSLSLSTDQRFSLNLQGQTGGTAANAEGIVVTVPTAQGAGGTVRYAIEIEWYEYRTDSAVSLA